MKIETVIAIKVISISHLPIISADSFAISVHVSVKFPEGLVIMKTCMVTILHEQIHPCAQLKTPTGLYGPDTVLSYL